MKKRSILGVVLFPFITLGIYTIYWLISTKRELVQKGADIPTSWLLIVPLANIYWLWKYYEGAAKVTNEKINGVLMFVIHFFITGIISSAICQDVYNNLTETVSMPTTPNPEPEVSTQTQGQVESGNQTINQPDQVNNTQDNTSNTNNPAA